MVRATKLPASFAHFFFKTAFRFRNMSAKKGPTRSPVRKGAKAATSAKQGGKVSGNPGQKTDGKGAAEPSSGSKPLEEPPSSQAPELSREAKAALTLQSGFRRLLACRERARRLKERQEYNELMECLQREAFVALVKREQEEAERERKREEEEKRKQREEQYRRKRMLEAAFDGDVEEMKAILKEVANLDTQNGVGTDEKGKAVRLQHRLNIVDCTDANGNTPLSEASGGGHPEAIRMLIENGANPNSRVASLDSLVTVLKSWDISLTEAMLQKMEAEQQRRAQEEKKANEAETHRMMEEVDQLAKEYERCSKELQQAYCELNRRIREHDKCQQKQRSNAEITLRAISDAEELVERLRAVAREAEEKLSMARLRLRERTTQEGSEGEFRGLRCSVQELDDVLLKDVGGRIQADGRWPVIIDSSGQAAIFLHYRDTNYLSTVNPSDMDVETIRLALLGALRYGKPLVFDMMEINMFDTVKKQLERIETGLVEAVLSKKILEHERYLSLVRPTDGPEYAETEFQAARTEKFKLFVVTKCAHPPEELLQRLLPVQVVLTKSSRRRRFRGDQFPRRLPLAP
uniref:IQ motif and ankyrin repeat domain-containing protein 1 isoform X5 n=1 Tax=Pogona vitticeps TaxID=103695 RepID=A0ABM5GDB1_9SAUR